MCIYHHVYKFETQVFKNHHKLMSLEMQSHFPSSPAKEKSEGGNGQDWEEEKAGRGNGQRQEWSWRLETDSGARLPHGTSAYHQLPPPVLQAYQPVTTPSPLIGKFCLCQDPRAPRMVSFFHIMQTPWLCTAAFTTSPASTSVPSRQVL